MDDRKDDKDSIIVKGGKRYCLLCSNYAGKICDDGTTVKLHCIPSGDGADQTTRRSLWIQKIKLVRPDAPISSNSRLCNFHFENNICKQGSIPSKLNLTTPRKIVLPRRPLVRYSEFENTENIPCRDTCISSTIGSLSLKESSETQTDPIVGDSVYVQTSDVHVRDDATQTQLNKAKCMKSSASQTFVPIFKPEVIENDDEKTKYYTGYPNYATFLLFFTTFCKHGAEKLTYWEGEKRTQLHAEDRKYSHPNIEKPGKKRSLRTIDEFFMVCLKLRHGLRQEFLADLFSVSVMTVSRIINTWINFMFDHMQSLIPWPSREQILSNLPKHYTEMTRVRIVVDATEFFCEKPGNLEAQFLTWSEYKHHNTYKVLIGVAPNGLVTFVSRVWGGHASDRHIVQKDGDLFLPKLEPGDVILADKGFTVGDLLPAHIGLNMPPFVSSSCQMSVQEFFKTQQIAAPRIVVEMKMEQIKNFKILQSVLPLAEVHLAEQIIMICCAMTNLYEPLLK
ncbi:uncharacterized protein LOC110445671 [Mizuhopecten yessoensis]|uniref:uncharacterized protein LOC110445671 n=1 Tax=Mizuhopecten yessoensis TaxID=6573 RepID=UPI000B45E99F|nr:uncharacterized protein LOC110445671 [Mizuhopecten yessoensis]